jgi:hypothetical protein
MAAADDDAVQPVKLLRARDADLASVGQILVADTHLPVNLTKPVAGDATKLCNALNAFEAAVITAITPPNAGKHDRPVWFAVTLIPLVSGETVLAARVDEELLYNALVDRVDKVYLDGFKAATKHEEPVRKYYSKAKKFPCDGSGVGGGVFAMGALAEALEPNPAGRWADGLADVPMKAASWDLWAWDSQKRPTFGVAAKRRYHVRADMPPDDVLAMLHACAAVASAAGARACGISYNASCQRTHALHFKCTTPLATYFGNVVPLLTQNALFRHRLPLDLENDRELFVNNKDDEGLAYYADRHAEDAVAPSALRLLPPPLGDDLGVPFDQRREAAEALAKWCERTSPGKPVQPTKIGGFFTSYAWAKSVKLACPFGTRLPIRTGSSKPLLTLSTCQCSVVYGYATPISRPIVLAQPPSKFCDEFSDVLAWDPAGGGGV